MEFIQYDASKPEEMDKLSKVVGMIREKQVAVANVDMVKAGNVVKEVNRQLPFQFKMHHHTKAWQHYSVRPATNSNSPEKTRADFCVFDKAHSDYIYTKAWVRFLVHKLSGAEEFQLVTGLTPIVKPGAATKSTATSAPARRIPEPDGPASSTSVARVGGL